MSGWLKLQETSFFSTWKQVYACLDDSKLFIYLESECLHLHSCIDFDLQPSQLRFSSDPSCLFFTVEVLQLN